MSDIVVQLVDAGPAKAEPRLTDAQKLLRDEEQKLLKAVREAAEKKKKEEEEKKKAAPPRYEITDKQSVPDALLAPDDRHAFLLVADKADGARVADVPSYVTESAYAEIKAARTKVGDAQERRRLAVMDLQTGKSVWASAAFAGPAPAPKPSPSPSPAPSPEPIPSPSPSASPSAEAKYREVRWTLPIVSRDGRYAVASVRSADNKDRWIVTIDPVTGDTRVLHHEHDDAWVRDMGTGSYGVSNFGFLPDGRTVFFTSERHGLDAPLHRRRRAAARPAPSRRGRGKSARWTLRPRRRRSS